jgi:hypothetical protein
MIFVNVSKSSDPERLNNICVAYVSDQAAYFENMKVSMNDREFSDIQFFQHSGKGIPLFMTGHKNCLQADYLLGPGPRLIKKNLQGRGLTKVEKHWSKGTGDSTKTSVKAVNLRAKIQTGQLPNTNLER